MDLENKITVKQSVLSRILKISNSTLSRELKSNNIEPIDAMKSRKEFSTKSIRNLTKNRSIGKISKSDKIIKKTHVFYNFKGGTGKTSICFQVSSMLALMGYKVLAIDLDPQAHLSTALNFIEDSFDSNLKYKTMYNIMFENENINEVIKDTNINGLSLIPGNIRLTKIEVPLSQKTKREEILKKIIDPIKDDYDFITIDTNPTISNLNMNALRTSDNINLICETQPFSLNGLGILVEELEKFYYELGEDFNYLIIPNKYEMKTIISQEALGFLRQDYKNNTTETVIRKYEEFNVSAKFKQPIFSLPSKNLAVLDDIIDLTCELLTHSTSKK